MIPLILLIYRALLGRAWNIHVRALDGYRVRSHALLARRKPHLREQEVTLFIDNSYHQ